MAASVSCGPRFFNTGFLRLLFLQGQFASSIVELNRQKVDGCDLPLGEIAAADAKYALTSLRSAMARLIKRR